jgi:menaquinone-dependent protoporphyrinogen oxidase
MSQQRVLVAFSSRSGSTAGTAEVIAGVLRAAGLVVDCMPAGDVEGLAPYRAIVLGSGVFVPSRASDGGGFLARYAVELATRPVWLFCVGPIGGHVGPGDGPDAVPECSAVTVGRAIGARDVGVFGTLGLPAGDDPVAKLVPADEREVRAWASRIAEALGPAVPPRRRHRCHRVAVAH